MTAAADQKAERRQDSAANKAMTEAYRAKVLADVKRFNDGERTIQEVASMAGISYSAAKSLISRNGLPKPKRARQS